MVGRGCLERVVWKKEVDFYEWRWRGLSEAGTLRGGSVGVNISVNLAGAMT